MCGRTQAAVLVLGCVLGGLGHPARGALAPVLFVSSLELGLVVRVRLDPMVPQVLPIRIPSVEGLVCGTDGRLYAAQSGTYGDARRIVSFAPDGTDLRTEIDFRSERALGGAPTGLLVGPGGQLFFNTKPTSGPHTGVWKFTPPRGAPTRIVLPYGKTGTAIARLTRGPFAGHLVAADFESGKLVRRAPPFDDARPTEDFIGGFPPQAIVGVAIGTDGEIFVSDKHYGVIRRCDPTGRACSIFARTLFQVRGISFDYADTDTLYVATFEGPVLRIRRDGAPSPLPGITVRGGSAVAVCVSGDAASSD